MSSINIHQQYLVLVDDNDKAYGKMEKMEVHRLGLLHRAFSVFVFNSKGEMLLQQRSDEKYHSPGLWTNACCSHPQFGEEMTYAVRLRLYREMGFVADTQFAFSFVYKVHFDNGLTEHEFDHVYIGVSDTTPQPDPAEVKDWKYMPVAEIEASIRNEPGRYTHWFRICFERTVAHFRQLKSVEHGV